MYFGNTHSVPSIYTHLSVCQPIWWLGKERKGKSKKGKKFLELCVNQYTAFSGIRKSAIYTFFLFFFFFLVQQKAKYLLKRETLSFLANRRCPGLCWEEKY